MKRPAGDSDASQSCSGEVPSPKWHWLLLVVVVVVEKHLGAEPITWKQWAGR